MSRSDWTPPHKRKRTEGDSGREVTKDQHVWLSDGNVVVISHQTAFRVHKSILAHHSEAFRDLFTLPESDVDEVMDGCPVVHLDSDEPADLRHLFLVVCCGKNYYHEKDEILPVKFDILAGLIRLAHKYAIPSVLNDALARLKKHFPVDLAAWQDAKTRSQYVVATPKDSITAIQLACLTNTLSILPTAYLACYGAMTDGQVPLDTSFALDLPTIVEIMRGVENVIGYAANRLLYLTVVVPSAACKTPHVCMVTCRTLAGAHQFGEVTAYDRMACHAALRPIADWFLKHPTAQLCKACTAGMQRYDREQIDDTWNKLPGMFGLDVEDWPKVDLD
ncbi:hypothetical protein C8Q80DRAFT_1214675 [Daedaleopsis nitida]|nr:hypothetical protein C8Q80DRAFT_1214675 [Daedaleopsis nitida]